MLTSDVLDNVCSYLPIEDIIALSYTSHELRDLILDSTYKKALQLHRPFYSLEYSQWDNWRDCATHLPLVDTRPFKSTLKCPIVTDEPLPDDFECFCKGVDLKTEIVYQDGGVLVNSTFVSLTETPGAKPKPPPAMFTDSAPFGLIHEVNYGEETMNVVGDFHRAVCTEQVMAAVSTYNDSLGLCIKDLTEMEIDPESADDEEAHPLYFANVPGKGPFRLQVVGRQVAIIVSNPGGSFTSAIFCPSGGLSILPYGKPLQRLPAGMLCYDGHVFDVFMDRSKQPVVQSTESYSPTPDEWHLNRYHKVEQDTRHTQYALVYNQHGGVSALIDLKSHQVQSFTARANPMLWRPPHEKKPHLIMVGMSKGKVGVWKFSEQYFGAKCQWQHSRGIPAFFDVFKSAEERPTPIHDFHNHATMKYMARKMAQFGLESWEGLENEDFRL